MSSKEETPDARCKLFRQASSIQSAMVIATGTLVLAGWLLDVSWIKQLHPSFVPMKANTAVTFIVLGVGLWLARGERLLWLRRACGLLVALVGAVTFAEYLLGVNIGIDELLFHERPPPRFPGRMAPLTTMTFAILGLALVAPDRGRWRNGKQLATLLAATGALVAICGYLYGATSLYAIGWYSAMALHTALTSLVACCALLFARPQEGVMRTFASSTAAGQLLRRLVPLFILAPIGIGWFRLQGEKRGYYAAPFGVALMALSNVVLVTIFTWRVARRLERSEERLLTAFEEIVSLNRNLEQRVVQRTKELEVAKERVDGIIALAADAIISVDGSERIAIFNKGAEEIFGWKEAEVVGQPLEVLLPQRFRQLHHQHVLSFASEATVARKMSERTRVFGLRRNGEEFPAEAAISKLKTDAGCLLTVILRDISARVRFEEERQVFFALLENSSDFIGIADPTGRPVYLNPAGRRMVGLPAEAQIDQTTIPEYYPPEDRAFATDVILRSMIERGRWSGETHFRNFTTEEAIPVSDEHFMIRDREGGRVLGMGTVTRDISERKRAEAALRLSEEFLSLAVEASEQGLWDWNLVTDEAHLSPRSWALIGRSEGEHRPELSFFKSLVHPDDLPVVETIIREHLEGKSARAVVEYRLANGSRHEVWLRGTGRVVARDQGGKPLRMAGVIADITREKRLAEERARSLREKETLLKEIHHRVKNNLQILSSLFYLQRERTDQEALRILLDESRNRIRSIALIHEKLYQSEDLVGIDFDDYLNDLTRELAGAMGSGGNPPRIVVRAAGVALDIDRAIPCALIVNELVSNSLKHAFPGGRSGQIEIEIGWMSADVLRLVVSDTGVGFPAELDFTKTRTLGMQLVCSLTTQLRGKVRMYREQGTRFAIDFPFARRPTADPVEAPGPP